MKKKRDSSFFSERNWRKFLLIMRLKVFLILVTCFQVSAAVHSQNKLLDMDLKNVSLEQVIWELERKTDFTFMYWTYEISEVKNLSLNMKQKSVNEVLDFCLRGTDLKYEINGDAVVIHKSKDEKLNRKNHVITGIVKDQNGGALPGVTVLVKGTTIGVATGVDGKFTMRAPRDTVHLLFSFVGMKTKEVEWKGQEMVIVVLEEDSREMDEVVVTGYQKIDKKLAASSTYSVKMADVFVPGQNNIEEMLQGEIPGLMVINSSGSTNSLPKVRVRGTSTLLGNAAPVWVIDGVIQEDPVNLSNEDVNSGLTDNNYTMFGNAISGVNPNDIESITFLKDAAATALYGTRAANGVIVVTTKKGKPGKTRISYNGTFGFEERPSYKKSANLMNSKERMELSQSFFEDGMLFKVLPQHGYEKTMLDYLQNKVSFSEVEKEYKERGEMNTDWFDLLFSNAFSHSHSLSISGGKDETTFYFSFGYSDNKGVADGDETQLYTASLRLNTLLRPWLRSDARIGYSTRKVDAFYSGNYTGTTDPMEYALTTSRALRADEYYVRDTRKTKYQNASGKYVENENDITFNIFNELANTGNSATTKSFNGNLLLNVDIFKDLKGEILLAYSSDRGETEAYATDRSYEVSYIRGYDYGTYAPGSIEEKASTLPYGGVYNRNDRETSKWETRFSLNYMKYWKETHQLSLMVGMQLSSKKSKGFSTSEYGYFPDRGKSFSYEYDGNTAGFIGSDMYTAYSSYSSATKHRVQLIDKIDNARKMYAALTYDYKMRYVLNGSFSVDATNRFGQNEKYRFSPVWSVSGRWNVSEETWMKNQNLVNLLAFKVSYGSQGNVVTAVSPELISYYQNQPVDSYTGQFMLHIKSLPYPDLKWEKTYTINAGMELGMWDSRFSAVVDYYYKRGNNIIYSLEVPLEYGIGMSYMNGADMINWGVEVSATIIPIKTENLTWKISPNFSLNRNRVSRPMYSDSYMYYESGQVTRDDYAVGSFWSWKFKELNPENGLPEYDFSKAEGYTRAELNDDPTLYMNYSGCVNPDVTGGFSTALLWNNFSIKANFVYSIGAKKRLRRVYQQYMTIPEYYTNLSSEFVDHWRKPGDVTNKPGFLPANKNSAYCVIPSGTSVNMYDMWDNSDIRVVKADYLRCKSISLGYVVPRNVVTKLGLSDLSIGLNLNNLFIIKDKRLKNQDPEVESTSVPILPSYNFSINLTL